MPAWMLEHDVKQVQQAARRRIEQQGARLRKVREKEDRARARYESGEPPTKRQVSRLMVILCVSRLTLFRK